MCYCNISSLVFVLSPLPPHLLTPLLPSHLIPSHSPCLPSSFPTLFVFFLNGLTRERTVLNKEAVGVSFLNFNFNAETNLA